MAATQEALDLAQVQTDRQRAARLFLSDVLASADAADGASVTVLDALRIALARALAAAGDLDAADAGYAAAADAAARDADMPPAAEATYLLEWAGRLAQWGVPQRSREVYERAMAVLEEPATPEETPGQREIVRLSLDSVLAELLYAEGDYEASAELWRDVLDRGQDKIDYDHKGDAVPQNRISKLEYLTWRNNAAEPIKEAGNPQEAAELLRAVLAEREAELGEGHPDTLVTRINLGYTLAAAGDLRTGEQMHRAAAAVAAETLGEGHHLTTAARRAVAATLLDAAGVEAAREAKELSLANIAANTGDDSDILYDLNNAGVAASRLDEHLEAAGYFRRVLAAASELVPPTHPMIVIVRGSLGNALAMGGELNEGRREMEAALALVEDRDSSTAAAIRSNLAMIAVVHADADEAAASAHELTELVALGEAGGWKTMVPNLRRNLARALELAGRDDEAKAAYQQAYLEGLTLGGTHAERTAKFMAAFLDRIGDDGATLWRRRARGEHIPDEDL